MAETKELWVPNELALEILGFNKNILEKRINADYIKREIRGGIELLEISGEIERFGLSKDVAQEKLDTYINKSGGEPTKTEVERPRSKTTIFEPTLTAPGAGVPVQPVTIPAAPIAPAVSESVKVIDHSPQLNKITQALEEIKKISIALPEYILQKTPKESNLPDPQIAEIKQELSKLAIVSEQNQSYKNEILALQTQLKNSAAEVTKLNTQSIAVMDELERTNQKHNKELESLKTTFKTEIGGVNALLGLKLKKPKSGAFTVLLILILMGAVGFLILELIQPTYSVLANTNDKINPLSKKDVTVAMQDLIDPFEEKLKINLANINSQNKEAQQKALTEISTMINSLLDSQKDAIKKAIETIAQNQKDSKNSLDENYSKSLKEMESKINDLDKLIKKMLETTVQIKPGSKFIPDSKE